MNVFTPMESGDLFQTKSFFSGVFDSSKTHTLSSQQVSDTEWSDFESDFEAVDGGKDAAKKSSKAKAKTAKKNRKKQRRSSIDAVASKTTKVVPHGHRRYMSTLGKIPSSLEDITYNSESENDCVDVTRLDGPEKLKQKRSSSSEKVKRKKKEKKSSSKDTSQNSTEKKKRKKKKDKKKKLSKQKKLNKELKDANKKLWAKIAELESRLKTSSAGSQAVLSLTQDADSSNNRDGRKTLLDMDDASVEVFVQPQDHRATLSSDDDDDSDDGGFQLIIPQKDRTPIMGNLDRLLSHHSRSDAPMFSSSQSYCGAERNLSRNDSNESVADRKEFRRARRRASMSRANINAGNVPEWPTMPESLLQSHRRRSPNRTTANAMAHVAESMVLSTSPTRSFHTCSLGTGYHVVNRTCNSNNKNDMSSLCVDMLW